MKPGTVGHMVSSKTSLVKPFDRPFSLSSEFLCQSHISNLLEKLWRSDRGKPLVCAAEIGSMDRVSGKAQSNHLISSVRRSLGEGGTG